MYKIKQFITSIRACLKKHFVYRHTPLCGIFNTNSLDAARCAALIWFELPIKFNVHPEKNIFQARSGSQTCLRAASRYIGPGLLSAILCIIFLIGNSVRSASLSSGILLPDSEAGLFSWSGEEVNKTDGAIFSLMKQEGLNALYQNFSSKNSRQTQMSIFVEMAMEQDIVVYDLTGDASWGLDPSGERLCEAVRETASYNRRIRRKFLARRAADGKPWDVIPQLAGIVFDVEPYTLEEWEKAPDEVMESFVFGMKEAYALAKDYHLEVIVCVPWYYEDKGQKEELEELIKNGCDRIAVMNYYRGAEIKNIATELELTKKYGKDLITIYELQKADESSVKEINTYYDLGLDGLKRNYSDVRDAYPGQPISIALHDYSALKEVLKNE